MQQSVEYSNGLIMALERSLRRDFNRDVQLTRQPSKRVAGFRVTIANGSKRTTDDGGVEHSTLQVFTSTGAPTTFYFSFSSVFEPTASAICLQHASLILFCDICAGELVSVFRAEWDAGAAFNSQSKHAQPHWHFVQRPERIERILKTLSGVQVEFTGDDEVSAFSERAPYENIHFAMAQLWNDKRPEQPHKDVFDSDTFIKWFDRVAAYVGEQLAYVADKMPARALRDFGEEAQANGLG